MRIAVSSLVLMLLVMLGANDALAGNKDKKVAIAPAVGAAAGAAAAAARAAPKVHNAIRNYQPRPTIEAIKKQVDRHRNRRCGGSSGNAVSTPQYCG